MSANPDILDRIAARAKLLESIGPLQRRGSLANDRVAFYPDDENHVSIAILNDGLLIASRRHVAEEDALTVALAMLA